MNVSFSQNTNAIEQISSFIQKDPDTSQDISESFLSFTKVYEKEF